MLNLKHLYYFHVFAQELSTTKTAKRLQISSPALSNQLKELEGFLGFKLIQRVRGQFIVTEKGQMVLHYAERMFAAYSDLKMKIALPENMESSHFRVGISLNLGARFAFDLIALILKDQLASSRKIDFTFESSAKISADFMQGKFDFIVGEFQPESQEENSLIYQDLRFPVRLFAPWGLMDGLGAHEEKVLISDINLLIGHLNAMKISLVIPAQGSTLRTETDQFLLGLKVFPERIIECNSSSGIVQLIERGRAVGFVPIPSLLDFRTGEQLYVLGPPNGYWSHGIYVLAQKSKKKLKTKVSPIEEAFLSEP